MEQTVFFLLFSSFAFSLQFVPFFSHPHSPYGRRICKSNADGKCYVDWKTDRFQLEIWYHRNLMIGNATLIVADEWRVCAEKWYLWVKWAPWGAGVGLDRGTRALGLEAFGISVLDPERFIPAERPLQLPLHSIIPPNRITFIEM